MGGGARSAQLGVAMSPKRRVRTRGQNTLVIYIKVDTPRKQLADLRLKTVKKYRQILLQVCFKEKVTIALVRIYKAS
jgi:hypothetical protein